MAKDSSPCTLRVNASCSWLQLLLARDHLHSHPVSYRDFSSARPRIVMAETPR